MKCLLFRHLQTLRERSRLMLFRGMELQKLLTGHWKWIRSCWDLMPLLLHSENSGVRMVQSLLMGTLQTLSCSRTSEWKLLLHSRTVLAINTSFISCITTTFGARIVVWNFDQDKTDRWKDHFVLAADTQRSQRPGAPEEEALAAVEASRELASMSKSRSSTTLGEQIKEVKKLFKVGWEEIILAVEWIRGGIWPQGSLETATGRGSSEHLLWWRGIRGPWDRWRQGVQVGCSRHRPEGRPGRRSWRSQLRKTSVLEEILTMTPTMEEIPMEAQVLVELLGQDMVMVGPSKIFLRMLEKIFPSYPKGRYRS